jgi:transposase
MKSIVYCLCLVALIACQNSGHNNEVLPSQTLLDSLMPYIAKKPDTVAFANRFDAVNKPYYDQQKSDKSYAFTHYAKVNDGYEYVMVKRLEPSLKHNKFSAVCVRFKRLPNGQIQAESLEELFWTWKMLPEQLAEKSDVLFDLAINQQSLSDYEPEKAQDEWIEFPGNGVEYDIKTHTWGPKSTKQGF